MRYSQDQKQKTHDRILDEAARRFRENGVSNTGLQPLMKALGLTHGGFYAHFKSKNDLVEAALQRAGQQVDQEVAHSLATECPLRSFIEGYLSEAHRDNPGSGCALPTMAAELGQRGTPSTTTDHIIRERLALLVQELEGDHAADHSILILSALVGALTLSRSIHDSTLSNQVLATTKQLLMQQYLTDAETSKHPAPAKTDEP